MSSESRTETSIQPREARIEDLERTCFVIMPFGEKKVGGRMVDFNAIYKQIFEPAITNAKTPEGQPLIAARTDADAFSSSINQEMFEYIMYSRLAFADISGFNPNVFYEIGARHSAQESGTVIFRQKGHEIPFDITSIKIFEYDHESAPSAETSSDFITNVLSQTLKRNRLDSPVRLALRAQWTGAPPASSRQGAFPTEGTTETDAVNQGRAREIERFMRDAEEALRLGDQELARINYWVVVRLDPLNTIARMRLGLTLKAQGKLYEALEEFITVTKLAPDYGEAWKEKGVVEGLIARSVPADKRPTWLPDGYASLERATMLIPEDFDAWASLGGVLNKVRAEPARARKMYARAAEISNGHPYPLLNALKLGAQATGQLDLEPYRDQLASAEQMRKAQTTTAPPTDAPWCFFDAAELRLFQGDADGFLEYLRDGIENCTASWQPETAHASLDVALVQTGIELPGLADGIKLLEEATKALSNG